MKRELSIPSHLNYLNEVENFVRTFLDDENLPIDQLGFVVLTVCETVNNAIIHGNRQNLNKHVYIRIQYSEYQLYIEIEDEGDGFNVDNIPDPTEVKNVKKERGRGIFIVKNLADHVEFANNGSLVKIKFNFNREHQLLL